MMLCVKMISHLIGTRLCMRVQLRATESQDLHQTLPTHSECVAVMSLVKVIGVVQLVL